MYGAVPDILPDLPPYLPEARGEDREGESAYPPPAKGHPFDEVVAETATWTPGEAPAAAAEEKKPVPWWLLGAAATLAYAIWKG